jgi:hypothetical protein
MGTITAKRFSCKCVKKQCTVIIIYFVSSHGNLYGMELLVARALILLRSKLERGSR